jgi:hypothetical protein
MKTKKKTKIKFRKRIETETETLYDGGRKTSLPLSYVPSTSDYFKKKRPGNKNKNKR